MILAKSEGWDVYYISFIYCLCVEVVRSMLRNPIIVKVILIGFIHARLYSC